MNEAQEEHFLKTFRAKTVLQLIRLRHGAQVSIDQFKVKSEMLEQEIPIIERVLTEKDPTWREREAVLVEEALATAPKGCPMSKLFTPPKT